MGAFSAFREGIRRVNGAPFVLAGMFTVTLLVAVPLSLALGGMIEVHLGRSLIADAAADATSPDWWQEFSSQASGLGTSFVPSLIGFGAVLDNVSGLLDNLPLAATVSGITAAWMVIWSFLSGGVLDRYARGRPTRAPGFFAACGLYFWRFVRLGVIAWLTYYVLFSVVHAWLFADLYERAVRDVTVERTAFAIRLGAYLVFVGLLIGCTLIFDYARIRIVVEDRRSAIGAVVAGARFVRRHAAGAASLYLLNGMAWLLLVLAYAVISPGAPGSGVGMWAVLLLGQLYILARHYLKLLFYASQTVFFQRALAHAAYTAAPAVVWPESPAAEAIANAEPTMLR